MKSVFQEYDQLYVEHTESFGLKMKNYHMHDKYEMSLFTSGSVVIIGGETVAEVTAPFIRIHKPFTVHYTEGCGNDFCVRTNIYFNDRIFDGIDKKFADPQGMFPCDLTVIKLDDERCGYLTGLVELMRNSGDKRTLALLICTMIAEADRLNTGERLPSDVPKYRYICDIIRQIRSDPFAEYSYSGLASDNFVSTSKLNRDFKRYTHTTLHEFVIRTRMFHAADILKFSSVADAAEKCGFEDVSHFIRTFRKYYGTTPLKYIKTSELPEADEPEVSNIL